LSTRSSALWMKSANKMHPTCDFEFSRIDPTCPRFVDVRFSKSLTASGCRRPKEIEHPSFTFITHPLQKNAAGPAGSGLGDRFLQMVVGLTYAIHLGGTLLVWARHMVMHFA
jgi:hypothetical protein